MNRVFGGAIALFAIVGLAFSQPYSPEQYELKLGREIKVMDVYVLRGTSTRVSRVQIRDENSKLVETQADTVVVRINAKCEVQGITPEGQEGSKLITIRNAQVIRNGQVRDVVPTGTSLKAEFSDSATVITNGGVPVAPEIAADLVPLIRAEGGRKTGMIIDAGKRVSVGQSWSINVKEFKKTFDDEGQKKAKNVKGKVTFVKIDSSGYRPAAVVHMIASAKDAVGEMGGARPSSSSIDASILLHVPTDNRYPAIRTSSSTKVVANFGKGKGSAVVEFSVNDDLWFDR